MPARRLLFVLPLAALFAALLAPALVAGTSYVVAADPSKFDRISAGGAWTVHVLVTEPEEPQPLRKAHEPAEAEKPEKPEKTAAQVAEEADVALLKANGVRPDG